METRWLCWHVLVICLMRRVISEEENRLIGDGCSAFIRDPDTFTVCGKKLASGITLKFSGKDSPPKECGAKVSPAEAAEVPVIKWPTADTSKYYTIVMVDPDAPNAKTHEMRYWIHWMVTGVSGKALRNDKAISGQEPISYKGPSPPKESGVHRYQIFIFNSSAGRTIKGIPEGHSNNKRAKFSLNHFIAANGFCDELVAGYEFRSENK